MPADVGGFARRDRRAPARGRRTTSIHHHNAKDGLMKAMFYSTMLAGVLVLGAAGPLQAQAPATPGTGQAGTQMQPRGGAVSGAATQDIRMSESQIESALKARGYSDIEGMERDGSHFRIGEATRYGKTMSDLRVDARTGQVEDEQPISEDQAREMLRARNFSDVSDMTREGDTISAKARQNDQAYEVRIDARSGTLVQQRASN
jgi:uncharacterized membrane protein YkoI